MNTISFRSELDVSLGNGIKSYLVVRTPCFHCQGHGFNLWSGKYDSASASKKKKKKGKVAHGGSTDPGRGTESHQFKLLSVNS